MALTNLLSAASSHCRRTGLSDAQFGRAALNDPGLMRDLRRGRTLRPASAAKVRAYLEGAA
ncbi:hypothetical protein [Sphingomonas sp. Leaf37]|uniref:hypothetical protein n=1 Tax=Sphingomonas sp. Leaf37 TaxID=2876552 RepID=UPI001E46BFA1|nr:hypothetical protein [Sphingomonas sp. Leaf37]